MKSEFLEAGQEKMEFDVEEIEIEEENEDVLGTPPETIDLGKKVLNVLPERSKGRYEMTYDTYMKWQDSKNIKSCTESVLLRYFEELSKKYKPSTLWSHYSMLRSMMNVRQNLDIAKYSQLNSFLKKQSVGFRSKKALPFTADNLKKFFKEAPDQQYLASKVIAIFGIHGTTRNEELVNLKKSYVTHADGVIIVRYPGSKTHEPKTFVMEGDLTNFVKRYEELRPENAASERYFLNYQNGKCTNQVIGINKFAKTPKQIATYLGLKHPDQYTCHSFKKIPTTIMSDNRVEVNMSFSTRNETGQSNKNKAVEGAKGGNYRTSVKASDAITQVDNCLFCDV